jgi:hypothetical protein
MINGAGKQAIKNGGPPVTNSSAERGLGCCKSRISPLGHANKGSVQGQVRAKLLAKYDPLGRRQARKPPGKKNEDRG